MLREINDDQLISMFKIRDKISQLNDRMTFVEKFDDIVLNANSSYIKYTSIDTMYKMLDSDSIYMFCSELSNDKTENKMLRTNTSYDSYISCFYNSNPINNDHYHLNSGDVLSQWMSYCIDGGASFEFYFGQNLFLDIKSLSKTEKFDKGIDNIFKDMSNTSRNQFNYSILSNNSSDSSDFILYPNFPFQVQYYENKLEERSDSFSLVLQKILKNYNWNIDFVLPYFKHSGFIQESEARLVFINDDNSLSDCIKFLTANDGSKIPYIEVKFGNNDLSNSPCKFVEKEKGESLGDAIEKKFKNSKNLLTLNSKYPIIIPQGRDQEEVYNELEKVINKLWSKENSLNKPKIICQGHLPITKIILAPTEDREQQRKKMEIYCKSKYWLRNVEIIESKIPYNTKNSNHL